MDRKESKYIQSLKDKKNRDKEGLFIIEGTKMITELWKQKYPIYKIYATEKWASKNHFSIKEVKIVPSSYLELWSSFSTPAQVIAIVPKPIYAEYPLLDKRILCLDDIQDPGNLGTIIRTAAWFGVETLICSQNTVDCFNPKAVQSAMGSIFQVQIYYQDLITFFQKYTQPIYAASTIGESIFPFPQITSVGAILMGNEGKGIHTQLLHMATKVLSIPPKNPNIESLNVAIAAGIILSYIKK